MLLLVVEIYAVGIPLRLDGPGLCVDFRDVDARDSLFLEVLRGLSLRKGYVASVPDKSGRHKV